MPTTPNLGWTIPASGLNPYFTEIVALLNAIDADVFARLPKAGGTLTGALTLAGDPTSALHAAPKQYVDAGDAGKVLKAGDTMTGPLTLFGDPTSALHAAPKQYVDLMLPRAGGSLTGALTLFGDPTSALHAAPKQYVDLMLPKAGGTLTGALLHPDGSDAAPSIAFASDPDTGFRWISSGKVAYVRNAEKQLRFGGAGFQLKSDASLEWSSGLIDAVSDLILLRDGPNALGLRNGGSSAAPVPQNMNVYNYFGTTADDYERVFAGFSANGFHLKTQSGGLSPSLIRPMFIGPGVPVTGGGQAPADAHLYWVTNNTPRFLLDSLAGHLKAYISSAYDIGAADGDPRDVRARRALMQTGDFGQAFSVKKLDELLTINAAANTDTAIQIPADALVLAVTTRVGVQPPGTTTYNVGVAGATSRYGSGLSSAVGSTSKGTLDGLRYYSGATAIRITPNATPSSTAGRIRVTIHFFDATPPTS